MRKPRTISHRSQATRTGREADRYNPELGFRVRKCGTCRLELAIGEYVGGNPNCRACREEPPALVLELRQDAAPVEPIPVEIHVPRPWPELRDELRALNLR